MPGFLWAAYSAGVVFLVLGVFSVKKEIGQARGLEKIVACASVCFAVPLVIFGSQHIAMAGKIMVLVPVWMPARLFWTYFVGCALFAAALSILSKRQVWLSSALLGIMFVVFEAALHIPRIVASPRDRFGWAVALRDISFAGGAFALAAMQTEAWRERGRTWLTFVARHLIALPAIYFGVENFLHPGFVPGIPLGKVTPFWIPFRLLWGHVAGVALVVAGAALLTNKKTRLVATLLGAFVLALVLFYYVPVFINSPLDIVALNFVADTLLYAGTILFLAASSQKSPSMPASPPSPNEL